MNKDWWLGRTPEQQAVKAQAKTDLAALRAIDTERPDIGKRISRMGLTLTIWLTLPVLGFALGGWLGLGVALVVALLIHVIRR